MRKRLAFALLLTATTAFADEPARTGEREFNTRCAVCHGIDAKGQGPIAEFFRMTIPNLTTLAKRNEGEFPFNHVFRTIDGREIVKAHGSRSMPVWGDAFRAEVDEDRDDFLGSARTEVHVAGRIFLLIRYLESLQE